MTQTLSDQGGAVCAAIYTLGCKLNQLESESIADSFRRGGFSIVSGGAADESESPDTEAKTPRPLLFIVNTCTVTSKSEQKARRVIRKALRGPSGPVVIVTGCYAQMARDALESLDSREPAEKRLFVIPGERKNALIDLPGFLLSRKASARDLRFFVAEWADAVVAGEGRPGRAVEDSFCFNPGRFTFHSRAFLKIQDGCDNFCAYCGVRLARGKSRSLGTAKTLTALRALEDEGYAEAVLTGVNISQYNDGEAGLAELLELLLAGTKTIAIRLSSIEPEVFSPGFIRALSHERIRPHFHLSLQSASPSILAGMNRRYTPEEALESVSLLCSAKQDPFLGCDVITGFPGERPEDFAQTLDFCAKVGFAGIHAFPFSRRPGTAAWDFGGRVPEHEAGLRAGSLIALAKKNRSAFIARQAGREIEAIVEDSGAEGFRSALSANYLRLLIPEGNGAGPRPGTAIRCKIGEAARNPESRFDAHAVII